MYEQHCAMDRFNVNSLKKATRNTDFNAYLKVCELVHVRCKCISEIILLELLQTLIPLPTSIGHASLGL